MRVEFEDLHRGRGYKDDTWYSADWRGAVCNEAVEAFFEVDESREMVLIFSDEDPGHGEAMHAHIRPSGVLEVGDRDFTLWDLLESGLLSCWPDGAALYAWIEQEASC